MTAAERVELTSAKNPLLRDVRRAVQRGSLTEDGFAVAESFHLLEEALRSDCEIHAILAAASVRSTVEALVKGVRQRVIPVDDPLFHAVSATESSQGVIALVKPRAWTMDQLFRGRSMVVVLDGIQDPGNAGAILRAAEAFGATGAMFVKGTCSPHNPKALRASAGSLFRVPYMHGLEAELVRAALQQRRMPCYVAHPRGKQSLGELNLSEKFAVVVGSEARGASPVFESAAAPVRIPTAGVESLNVAVAAGIFLYEASRQRTMR